MIQSLIHFWIKPPNREILHRYTNTVYPLWCCVIAPTLMRIKGRIPMWVNIEVGVQMLDEIL